MPVDSQPAAAKVDDEPSMDPGSPNYKDMSKFFVVPDESDESSAPSVCFDALDISDNMSADTEQAVKEKALVASPIAFIPQVQNIVPPAEITAPITNQMPTQEAIDFDEDRLYDLIVAYLHVIPSPTDEQFHMLATAVGMEAEQLEAFVYQVTATLLESAEPSFV